MRRPTRDPPDEPGTYTRSQSDYVHYGPVCALAMVTICPTRPFCQVVRLRMEPRAVMTSCMMPDNHNHEIEV